MKPYFLLALFAPIAVRAAAATTADLTCVTKSGKTYKEPSTLSALVACQKKKLAKNINDYQAKNHFDAPDATVESWQDVQRAEVGGYVARHPERAGLDVPKEKTSDAKSESSKAQEAAKENGAKQTADVQDLAKTLQQESNGGKDGVTPQMAGQINDYLQKNQGSVSPDMQDLLNSVQKDGVNLKPETINKLKHASQQAKQGGLDLNVDQKTQDFLLSPKEPSPNSN